MRTKVKLRGTFKSKYLYLCGNIMPGQRVTITHINDPCAFINCPEKKRGACNGVSYTVKEYDGDGNICSNAIILNDTLDHILGLY